jgi:hypothetical protein
MTRPLGAALLAILGSTVAVTSADAGGLDVFGGYSYTRRTGVGFNGGELTATWRLAGRLAVAADVARHQATVFGLDVRQTSLAGGPRLYVTSGKTRIFLRVLAGAIRTSESVAFFDGDSHSTTDLALLAGGGVERALGPHWGLRLSGDYFRVQTDPEATSSPRGSLGVTYRFGTAP